VVIVVGLLALSSDAALRKLKAKNRRSSGTTRRENVALAPWPLVRRAGS
jgi:hypothetical protein